MKRTISLRTQLTVGLSLIVLVATVSIGVIIVWTTRQQVSRMELENGRLLGQALANVLAGPLSRAHGESTQAQGGSARPAEGDPFLLQTVSHIAVSPSVRSVVVVDRELRPLFRSTQGRTPAVQNADLAVAVNTRQQVVRNVEVDAHMLVVSTPIVARGALVGGVRLQLLLGPDRFGWPLLFWILMALDGGVMVLFVGLVLTAYGIRPIEAMQKAAARVAKGDLQVRLAEEGAYEFASLARSFNAMTASVDDQLRRLEQQRQELATSREHLIRSEKLASVGRLAAGVAHEVGNPLQSIVGLTEILLGEPLDAEQRQDFLRRVRGEGQRINQIIRELLDYARPVDDAVEAARLAAVVEQTVQLLGPQKRLREVELVQRGLVDLPAVAANARRLVQVLVNVLLNAADAMEGEGTVTLRGEVGDADQGGQVRLHIANSGPTIPAEDRSHIFDPFFSTKDPGKGTGLGLSVARSIIESFGGSIELAEGEPTTFVITLNRWVVAPDEPEKNKKS